MKRKLFKLGAAALAAAMLLTVPTSAVSFSHYQGTIGQSSGSDSGITSWTLLVSFLQASASGSINPGYTGTVQCGITVNGQDYTTTGNNSNTLYAGGVGDEAWILFNADKTRIYANKEVIQGYYGSKVSSSDHCNWNLNVSPTSATSHGWMGFGYTDYIQCYAFTSDQIEDSRSAWDDCQASVSGDGNGAEVSFS